MKKVIYIASLPHSGSTLLDFLLSLHPDIVGLGEVYGVLRGKPANFEATDAVCSGGEAMDECPIWSRFSPQRDADYGEDYARLLCSPGLSGQGTIVDSSKDLRHLEPLRALADRKKIDLRVVFLLRDVRGWVTSIRTIERRRGRRPRPIPYYYWLWWKKNRAFMRYLNGTNLPYRQVGYPALCRWTKEEVRRLLHFTGVGAGAWSLDNEANTHIAYGNRAKKDPSGMRRVTYDARWRSDRAVRAWSRLLIPILRWNRANVPGVFV